MLTSGERAKLEELLLPKFINNPQLGLAVHLGSDFIADLPAHATPRQYLSVALDRCLDSGWARQPPLLLRLLKDYRILNSAIEQICTRLENGPPVLLPQMFETPRVRRNRVFINRRTLRDQLKLLASADRNAFRLLMVTGPRRSGKSYSAELIVYLAEALDTFRVALIELPEGTGATFSPESLASSVVRNFGRSASTLPPQESQPARWCQVLAEWILNEAAQSQRTWWIVLDGLNDPDLPDGTHQLIGHLLLKIARGGATWDVRLILLGYTYEKLPPNVRRDVAMETISEIGEEDLRAFFRIFMKDAEDGAVDQAVAIVLERTQEDHSERLVQMSTAVEEVLDALYPA